MGRVCKQALVIALVQSTSWLVLGPMLHGREKMLPAAVVTIWKGCEGTSAGRGHVPCSLRYKKRFHAAGRRRVLLVTPPGSVTCDWPAARQLP